jgi:hypothetical protein
MADRPHADVDQIVRCELRQHLGIDVVVAESGFIPLETQPPQPRR